MARVSPNQTSFSGGEFSPLLYGRVDAERYKTGLAKCLNFIPTLQGAAVKRSGTRYVAEVKEPNKYTRLIPFKYSTEQNYILEFGDGYIRFYTEHGQIQGGGSPYEITSPYDTTDLPDIKYCQSLDVLYLTHPSFAPRKLARYGNTDWVLSTIDIQDGPYLKIGYPENRCVISSDNFSAEIYIDAATGSSVSVIPQINGGASLSITAIANNGSGACRITIAELNVFADRSKVTVSNALGTTGANGNWVVNKISSTQYDLVGSTFNAAYIGSGVIRPNPFATSDVNRLLRAKVGANAWGWARITNVGATGNATVSVVSTFGAAGNTVNFRFGAWCEEDGYPSCCVFHEDRLFFGASGGLQRIDGSNTSDYENFSPSALDASATIVNSNAVSFTLNSNDANAINWMTSDERGMPIGTSGGPWILRPSVLSEALTATNVSAKRVNTIGSNSKMAVIAGKSSVYLENNSRRLREMSYFYDVDGFRSVDLTEIAEHLPSVGVVTEIAFQSVPQPLIWMARDDGILLSVTYDRNLDSLRTGWHQHILGGRSDPANTPPIVESLAVIPNSDSTVDDLWMVVQRYIDGNVVRYVEYMDKMFEQYDEQEDAFFLDCGFTYDDPKTVTAITTANPAVATAASHGLTTGDQVRFQDIVGLKDSDGVGQINNRLFSVTVLTANTFEIDDFDSTDLTPFVQGGVVRNQIVSLTDLDWLEGETVGVVGDGSVLADKEVVGGEIDLSDYPAGKIHIGLRYNADLKQLRLEGGSQDGTSIGKTRRAEQMSVMVNRSGPFFVGTSFDSDKMSEVIMRQADDPMDYAAPLFSGIKDNIALFSDYNLDNQICIRSSDPVPCTVLAIMPQLTVYDRG